MTRLCLLVALAVLCAGAPARAQAAGGQASAAQTFTLGQAIEYAAANYPAMRAAMEQVNVSAAGVNVARSAYLPRLDSVWQSNRATANNIFGQLLPQSVIPSMSGPVLPAASSQTVWGSAAGALFSWEPFDFGRRHASVENAEAGVARARAGETLTKLDVEAGVAAAFLDVVAAQQAAVAAQADFDRRQTLQRAVQALVDNQLRPGAEASRADAERAAAATRLIELQQTVSVARTRLGRLLGATSGPIDVSADALTAGVPAGEIAASQAAAHPLAQVQQAAVEQARAAEQALSRTDLPRVYVESSVFARGSGANQSGSLDGGVDGLGLDRANWAAGVQVVFPNLFDFSALKARKAAAAAATRGQTALHEEALLEVTAEQQATAAQVQAARAVAANTPVALSAAQQSESQARARYNSGLATLVEEADAQSLLAQAEMEDHVARVNVWRALLAAAVAQGDLEPFVALVRQP